MIDFDKARSRVLKYINRDHEDDIVILDDLTLTKNYGWIFFYQNQRCLDATDIETQMLYALYGNGPIIVMKRTGRMHVLPTYADAEDLIKEFEASRIDPKLWEENDREEYMVLRYLVAVREGDVKTVNQCLDAGVPVDSIDRSGWTALIIAAWKGQADVARLLAERGGDLNYLPPGRRTALMTAAEYGNLNTLRLLIYYGADVNMRTFIVFDPDHSGYVSALSSAEIFERNDPNNAMVRLLKEAGAIA